MFFSGDAGLKFLVIKQINNTGEYKSLNLQQPEWVQKIWQRGFYPFKEPFIYNTSLKHLIAFPPAFQWLNACLYKWLGYRGMYIIPCMSLVLLWLCFLSVFRRSKTNIFIVSFGLFLLAFCSPLTLYAAVYWEHTLAVLLTFAGVAFIVRGQNSFLQSLALGIITGLSIWFRPEALVLSGLFAGVALYNFFITKRASYLCFLLGFVAMLIVFFLFNFIVYRNLLGAHAFQVIDQKGNGEGLQNRLAILTHVNARFFIFFPAAILFYGLAAYLRIKRQVFPVVIYQLVAVIIIYSLITPFLLPNAGGKQWGPRYFLPLVPLMLVTVCLAYGYISLSKSWIIFIIPLLLYSAYLNVYQAGITLRNDYSYRVRPALTFLENRHCKVVIVQNQYIAQEFAAAFDKKIFFLAEGDSSFNQLMPILRQEGVSCLIYMDIENREKSLPNALNQGKRGLFKVGNYFFAEYSVK